MCTRTHTATLTQSWTEQRWSGCTPTCFMDERICGGLPLHCSVRNQMKTGTAPTSCLFSSYIWFSHMSSFFVVWISLQRSDVGQAWRASATLSFAPRLCRLLSCSNPQDLKAEQRGLCAELTSHFFYSTILQFDTHSYPCATARVCVRVLICSQTPPSLAVDLPLTDVWPWLSPLWCFIESRAALCCCHCLNR